jgi:ABC-type glycerol-3-phosphate transport system substrate-binding protein
VTVIWYRKDIFVEEGLSPPRSWEELVVVAQYLQDEEVRKRHHLGPFPLAFPAGSAAGETTTYILIALIWAAGGEIISGERVVLDEGSRQALEFLRDLVHKHQVASPDASSYGFNEVPKLFARGEVALAFGGSYEKALIQEVSGWDDEAFRKRVGFIPIPAGPEGRLATTVGGMVYVIFRQSPYPQAALEILKLLASPPLMREFCRKTGRRPTQGSIARALDPERDWFIYETNELLEMARVRPTIPQYARISQQLQVMVASILEQRESIDEAIARAQAVIEALA